MCIWLNAPQAKFILVCFWLKAPQANFFLCLGLKAPQANFFGVFLAESAAGDFFGVFSEMLKAPLTKKKKKIDQSPGHLLPRLATLPERQVWGHKLQKKKTLVVNEVEVVTVLTFTLR